MRRIYDPTQYEFLQAICSRVNRLITISAFMLFAAQMIFLVNFIVQLVQGREGGTESVARQRSRVGDAIATSARELPGHAACLPGPVRVQLAARQRGRLSPAVLGSSKPIASRRSLPAGD